MAHSRVRIKRNHDGLTIIAQKFIAPLNITSRKHFLSLIGQVWIVAMVHEVTAICGQAEDRAICQKFRMRLNTFDHMIR